MAVLVFMSSGNIQTHLKTFNTFLFLFLLGNCKESFISKHKFSLVLWNFLKLKMAVCFLSTYLPTYLCTVYLFIYWNLVKVVNL